MGRGALAAGLVAAMAFALAGCASSGSNPGGSPAATAGPSASPTVSTTATTLDPSASVGDAAPQTMASRDDLASTYPVAWDSWRLVSPTRLEVTFLAGPSSCDGIHAEVTETERDVTIDLASGTLPGAGPCRAIALTTTTIVTLASPLDGREVRQSVG